MANVYHMTPQQVEDLTFEQLFGFLEKLPDVMKLNGATTDGARKSGFGGLDA